MLEFAHPGMWIQAPAALVDYAVRNSWSAAVRAYANGHLGLPWGVLTRVFVPRALWKKSPVGLVDRARGPARQDANGEHGQHARHKGCVVQEKKTFRIVGSAELRSGLAPLPVAGGVGEDARTRVNAAMVM